MTKPKSKTTPPLLPPTLASRFKEIIERLLAGESLAPYENDLSTIFEGITTNLFATSPQYANCYFDGVTNETHNISSPRTIDFKGEMWIGRNRDQWTEPFKARIVDNRLIKQGISVTIWIAQDKAQGSL